MIESLESRIAPAAVVHFFEADGDKVTVKTTLGTKAQLLTALTDQGGAAITEGETGITSFNINFLKTAETTTAFANTDLTVTAKKANHLGNNQVNFMSINAFDGGAGGIDVHNVTVKGNLVFIDAGNANLTTPAINKLVVTRMAPGDGSNSAAVSQIQGNINTVIVTDDFNGFIRSENSAGAANFQTNVGTVIGKFLVLDDIASSGGADVGHLQVRSIANLIVKSTFFGALAGGTTCGLIEADSIKHMNINVMSTNARIVLT